MLLFSSVLLLLVGFCFALFPLSFHCLISSAAGRYPFVVSLFDSFYFSSGILQASIGSVRPLIELSITSCRVETMGEGLGGGMRRAEKEMGEVLVKRGVFVCENNISTFFTVKIDDQRLRHIQHPPVVFVLSTKQGGGVEER